MPALNSNRGRIQSRIQEKRNHAKVPYKKKRTLNGVKVSPDVIKQKSARNYFESMKSKLSLKAVREIGTGVDFVHNFFRGKERLTTRFDLKFSYGQLGNHVIKVRLLDRRLLNNAEWAMSIGRNKEIEFFPMKALSEYILKNYGTISQHVINKGTYSESAVSLTDFYAKMKIKPVKATFKIDSIKQALERIELIEHPIAPKKQQPKPLPKKTTIKLPPEVERRQKRLLQTNPNIIKKTVNRNKPNGFFIPRPTQRNK